MEKKIYFNGELPEFFLVHKSVDDAGNIKEEMGIAANYKVNVFSHNRCRNVPMIYAWSKGDVDNIDDWIWTDDPAFVHGPSENGQVISADAKIRLESLGYSPVLYTTSTLTTVGPEYHLYAKLSNGQSLERGSKYIEYLPNGEWVLKRRDDHPKIMTLGGLYERLAMEEGREIPETHRRKEYIFGLSHLFGRLHYSKGDRIETEAVLIITQNDVNSCKRIDVIHRAIEMGFDPDDLNVLIRMMAHGYVVFDTHYACYGIEKVFDEKTGYRNFSDKLLLTENEFFETYAYKTAPGRALTYAEYVYRACAKARDLGWQFFKGMYESIPDERLVRVEHR